MGLFGGDSDSSSANQGTTSGISNNVSGENPFNTTQSNIVKINAGDDIGRGASVNVRTSDFGAIKAAFNFANQTRFDALNLVRESASVTQEAIGEIGSQIGAIRPPDENLTKGLLIVAAIAVASPFLFKAIK